MKFKVQTGAGSAVLCAGLLLAASCSHPSSLSPAAPAATAPQIGHQARISAETVAFPLLTGSFAIANRSGDGLTGIYAGTAVFSGAGVQNASLTLQIVSGSGAFAGATGTVAVTGDGAFADEGSFSLNGMGEVMLNGGRRAVVVLSLRGASLAGCSPAERIAISQTADGIMSRGGRVTATLSHEVGSTGCIS